MFTPGCFVLIQEYNEQRQFKTRITDTRHVSNAVITDVGLLLFIIVINFFFQTVSQKSKLIQFTPTICSHHGSLARQRHSSFLFKYKTWPLHLYSLKFELNHLEPWAGQQEEERSQGDQICQHSLEQWESLQRQRERGLQPGNSRMESLRKGTFESIQEQPVNLERKPAERAN